MTDNGWGIPPTDVQDWSRRDSIEAELILHTLQEEVVPLYYQRGPQGHSTEWVRRAKQAMMTVIPRFNMQRVLRDYTDKLYRRATEQYARLSHEQYSGARQLAEWKQRVRQAWSRVDLRLIEAASAEIPRDRNLRMRVAVSLAGLQPGDVRVEFVARRLLPQAATEPPPLCSFEAAPPPGVWHTLMQPSGAWEGDAAVFQLDAEPPGCGQFASEVRIYPWHELLAHPYGMGLMKWL